MRRADDLGEFGKEIIGHLARRAIDQPRTDLRQLAADGGIDAVFQQRPIAIWLKVDLGAAAGKAGGPALAFAGDLVAVGRIEVAERYFAVEAGLHRADAGGHPGHELRIRGFLQFLAAGDALLQDLGIVQGLPHGLARGGNAELACHVHGGGSFQSR